MAILKFTKDVEDSSLVTSNGFVVVTGGWDYITVDSLETNYLDDVSKASSSTGKDLYHVEVEGTPRTSKALGVSVVPTIIHVVDGVPSSSLVGVCGTSQVEAFLKTGVSPL